MILVSAAILACGFLLYSYLTPVIRFAISKRTDPNAGSYAQMVTVGCSTKLGLPVPPNVQKNLAAFGAANAEALAALRERYTSPMQINASVEVVDRQTIVTYSGTATDKNNGMVPYEKVLRFDFVLTEETP